MINVLCMCTVWGEPLSQTAQSFMPELIYGANQNLTKVPIDYCVRIYADNKFSPLLALIAMCHFMIGCPCATMNLISYGSAKWNSLHPVNQ